MKKRIISLSLAISFVMVSALSSYAAECRIIDTKLEPKIDAQGNYVLDENGQKVMVESIYEAHPTSISYKDLKRLREVVKNYNHENKKDDCHIVNAKDISGNGSKWVVRVQNGVVTDEDSGNHCNADFVVSLLDLKRDKSNQKILSLGFDTDGSNEQTVKNGSKVYGPCWYYWGIYDSQHRTCGFALAERINRWPDWRDLRYDDVDPRTTDEKLLGVPARSFLGTTYRGEVIRGSYDEPNSFDEKANLDFLDKHMN